jgi:hypothetical protein
LIGFLARVIHGRLRLRLTLDGNPQRPGFAEEPREYRIVIRTDGARFLGKFRLTLMTGGLFEPVFGR